MPGRTGFFGDRKHDESDCLDRVLDVAADSLEFVANITKPVHPIFSPVVDYTIQNPFKASVALAAVSYFKDYSPYATAVVLIAGFVGYCFTSDEEKQPDSLAAFSA
jgi:hypothetical protein